MNQTFDVVIIGGGPGGYTCAAQLAQAGKTVALVEQDALGGTCLNRGCIPTKALLHAAELLDELKQAQQYGLSVGGVSVDYAALLARKQEVVETLRQGVSQLLSSAKVTVIQGKGFVFDAGRVEVTTADGTLTLEAGDIVAAVGSAPAMPPILGIGLPGVITSDALLETLPQLEHLVIIGGGVIGMEFASLYSSFGTQVTVLEGMPRILPIMDREIGQSLSMLLKKRGVEIVTDAMVGEITQSDGRLRCSYAAKGLSLIHI